MGSVTDQKVELVLPVAHAKAVQTALGIALDSGQLWASDANRAVVEVRVLLALQILEAEQ